MTPYFPIQTFERGPLMIILDKTYEETPIRDFYEDFGESWYQEREREIESFEVEWFVLRARAFFEGTELAVQSFGGCLYNDALEVLTDGTAEDLIAEVIYLAKDQLERLKTVDLSGL